MEIEKLLKEADEQYVKEDYYKAYDLYNKAYILAEKNNDPRLERCNGYLKYIASFVFDEELEKGDCFIDSNEFDNAIKSFKKAEEYAFKENDKLGQIKGHLVVMYEKMNDYDKALKNALEAIDLFDDKVQDQISIVVYHFVTKEAGTILLNKGEYKKAIEILNKGLSLINKFFPENIADGNILRKDFYLKLAECYKMEKDFVKQEEYLNRAKLCENY